jgi:hypothetical protein
VSSAREMCAMSMKDFHAKLVSADCQNPLFAALRQLSQIADSARIFSDEEPTSDWPVWTQDPPPPGYAHA